MFVLSALLLQATTLPAETTSAALTCSQAVAVAEGGDSHMRRVGQVSYFVMEAAKASPGKPFLDQVNALMAEAGKIPVAKADAPALILQCDKRFPLARAQSDLRLSTDALERDVTCFGMLALFQGAAQKLKQDGGDSGPLDRIETLLEPISARLTDAELQRRGLHDEAAFVTYMGDRLKATLAQGNPESVARACGLAAL